MQFHASPIRRSLRSIALVIGILGPSAPVAGKAQETAARYDAGNSRPDSLLVGRVARDRARLREITGVKPDSAVVDTTALYTIEPVLPALLLVNNSDLPAFGNDGALWAGRGLNVAISGGVQGRLDLGDLRMSGSLVPVITYSANDPFTVMPGAHEGRSGFSSPWHVGAESADLPLRFGTDPLRTLSFGETYARVASHNVAVSVGWMSHWWGPGIRNAILMSNNAPTIPQLQIGTDRPARTRIGDFDAMLMVGTLSESPYFDLIHFNDHRSLSGLHVQYRPTVLRNLQVGFAHLVMRPIEGPFSVKSLHEAITRWDRGRDGEPPLVDQLLAFHARWFFPASGFEVYGEWARMEPPASLYDWAVASHRTQGYTIGAQWAAPMPRESDRLRLQVELTNLEQSWAEGGLSTIWSYYVGRATSHGFTQRGQVLGATVGPGGSSQWIAADYVAPRWQAGAFIGRNRWENDALYRQPVINFNKHDVSIQSGLRGAYAHRLGDIGAELAISKRMNYLFQTDFGVAGGYRKVDIQNIVFSLSLTPGQRAGALVRRARPIRSSAPPSATSDTLP